MSIESLYADRIEEAIQRQLRNPGPAPAPASFNLWSMLAAGGKAPVSGGLESAGSLSDLLSGFGTALAASGGSGGGMFSVPSAEEAKQEKEARDRMLKGEAFDTTAGRELRRRADEFGPDPQTSHKADQVVHGLIRGVTKAAADVGFMGPVAGPVTFGLDEGNTAAQRLIEQGVDTNTAATVGTITGIVQAVGAGVPAVGPTVKTTLGLAAIAGPASFATQEAAARRVLQRANYPDLAATHDPLDPLGLALSIGIPGAVAGLHIRGLKKTPELADVVKHIESGGKRFDENGNLITSPKGAQGEMQVMPKTATDPGFGVVPAKDNSPGELARVGRDYLAAMQQKYGDTDKALAAYNAGPGAVDAAVKAHGGDWLAHLPDETQKYVAKANKLMGDHIAGKGAEDPAVVDAARVKVLDSTLKDLPLHPEAHADLMRSVDAVSRGDIPAAERAALAHAYDSVWASPQGDKFDPLVMIRPDDIEAVAVARGGWKGIGDAEVTGQGFGLVKFIWRHGEESNKPQEFQVTREDVLAFPDVARRLEATMKEAGGQTYREWRAELPGRDGTTRQVVYVDKSMGDQRHVVSMYVQEPGRQGSDLPPSKQRPDWSPESPGKWADTRAGDTPPSLLRPSGQDQSGAPSLLPEGVALKPETAKSTSKDDGAVDQARLKQLLEERPHLEEAILRAHEQYDEDVSLADLVKVAFECALANGG